MPPTTTVALTVPRSGHGPITVDAEPVTPGLYIHPTGSSENQRPHDQWRLAHHSGRAIGAFPTEEQARQAGADVADLTDWTRAREDLARSGEVDLWELAERLLLAGGILLRNRDES